MNCVAAAVKRRMNARTAGLRDGRERSLADDRRRSAVDGPRTRHDARGGRHRLVRRPRHRPRRRRRCERSRELPTSRTRQQSVPPPLRLRRTGQPSCCYHHGELADPGFSTGRWLGGLSAKPVGSMGEAPRNPHKIEVWVGAPKLNSFAHLILIANIALILRIFTHSVNCVRFCFSGCL